MNQICENTQESWPNFTESIHAGRKSSLLLVYKYDPVRSYLKQQLISKGFDVLEAADGEQGIQIFMRHRPAIVVFDITLPVLNSIDFLSQLEQEHRQKSQFIAVTPQNYEKNLEPLNQLGVQFFLTKPIKKHSLLSTVDQAMELILAKEKIQYLNDWLSLFITKLPCIVWELGQDLKFTHLSSTSSDICEYKVEELIGRQITDFIEEKYKEEFRHKATENIPNSENGSLLKSKVILSEFNFISKSGKSIPMKLQARSRKNHHGEPIALVGIMENLSKIVDIKNNLKERKLQTSIEVNSDLKIISAEHELNQYIHLEADQADNYHRPSITDYLMDQDLEKLMQFAFEQKEDIPFPIDLEFEDRNGHTCHFHIQFAYDPARNLLHGQSIPSSSEDSMIFLQQAVEQEKKKLNQAVIVDAATQKSILTDCYNLIAEILSYFAQLEPFAFDSVSDFKLDKYEEFLHGKKLLVYQETLRFFANKLHGLKGTAGFLAPEIKNLCHQLENIVKPLSDLRLVYTGRLAKFFKNFILYVQDLMDQYTKNPESLQIDQIWIEWIGTEQKISEQLIDSKADDLKTLIKERCHDNGKTRKRKTDQTYVSVHKSSYFKLLGYMQSLFYGLINHIPQEAVVQVNKVSNDFMVLHQEAQHVPLNLTRYDRLVPGLAQEYGKQAEFKFIGQQVKADVEFWNSIHEIINHCVKNAIVHGLEKPEDRTLFNKREMGLIEVELKEDSMNFYLEIRDDGEGLDPDIIKEKVLSLGLMSQKQISRLNNNEIFQLLFIPGFSTVKVVDQNAGRGVGLNAVQEAMKKEKGTCKICSEKEIGTKWKFAFTKSNVSLPCVVVQIGTYKIAIPESSISKFQPFNASNQHDVIQDQCWEDEDTILPLISTENIFSEKIKADSSRSRMAMILKTNDNKRYVIIINNIVLRASLPFISIHKDYEHEQYLGTALFKSNPIMVLNCAAVA